ncbi:hypothetical protein AB833_07680 [Chromatiales bacterium (ex Bugula neritina AB1)]|nr:hypothetical protein AB833_07680 [Chromatiales bacterium (ex Bugula neritina AB1)]
MNSEEWESLCDGCGRCCLQKLQTEHEHLVRYTRVACRLLDVESCQCTNYWRRKALVPECISLTADMLDEINWLPKSCAYVRIKEKRGLAEWHPLVSGNKASIHEAGISMSGKVMSESNIHPDDFPSLIIEFTGD